MTMTTFHTAQVNNQKVFYHEAGHKDTPIVLLLHGFPSSSNMFRNLIPALADRYRVVAPDLPGFGFSDAPDRAGFAYTFRRDIPNAEVQFYGTGHFALETHHAEIAAVVRDFLARTVTFVQSMAV